MMSLGWGNLLCSPVPYIHSSVLPSKAPGPVPTPLLGPDPWVLSWLGPNTPTQNTPLVRLASAGRP